MEIELNKNNDKSIGTNFFIKKDINYDDDIEDFYLIHDNFQRPFDVRITKDNIMILAPVSKDELTSKEKLQICPCGCGYPMEVIWETNTYNKVFIGYDNCDKERTIGNTILINLKDLDYLWIGKMIYQFTAKYEIIDFHAPIGNNDCPYPYAIDINNGIYMDQQRFICSKEQIESFDHFSISEIPYYLEIEKRLGIKLENFGDDLEDTNVVLPNNINNEILGTSDELRDSSDQVSQQEREENDDQEMQENQENLNTNIQKFHFVIVINNKAYDKCCDFPEIRERKLMLQDYGHPFFLENLTSEPISIKIIKHNKGMFN